MDRVRLFTYRTSAFDAGTVEEFASLADLLAFGVAQGHPIILDGMQGAEWLETQHGKIDGTLEIYDGYRE